MMDRSHLVSPHGATAALREPVSLEVPVRIQAEPGQRATFFEDTQTVLVFAEGAVLRVGGDLQSGQRVLLTNRWTRRQLPCRVVFMKRHGGVKGYCELEFAAPAAGFWDAQTAEALPPPSSAGMPSQQPLLRDAAAALRCLPSMAGSALPTVPQPFVVEQPRPFHLQPIVEDIETLLARRAAAERKAQCGSPVEAAPEAAWSSEPPPMPLSLPAPVPRSRVALHVLAAASLALLAATLGAWRMTAVQPAAEAEPPPSAGLPAPPVWLGNTYVNPLLMLELPLRDANKPTRLLRPLVRPRTPAELRRPQRAASVLHGALARRSDVAEAPAPDIAEMHTAAPEAPANLLRHAAAVPPPAALPESQLQPLRLLLSTRPAYPPAARRMRLEGEVVIHALVDVAGKVTEAKVVSGPVLLRQAALDAFAQWKYAPAMLNGKPVATHTAVTIKFLL
jgi:TonB family protein